MHFSPKVMQLATEVLSMIPNTIDYQKAEKLIGADKKPLDIVLLQEVSFFYVILSSSTDKTSGMLELVSLLT